MRGCAPRALATALRASITDGSAQLVQGRGRARRVHGAVVHAHHLHLRAGEATQSAHRGGRIIAASTNVLCAHCVGHMRHAACNMQLVPSAAAERNEAGSANGGPHLQPIAAQMLLASSNHTRRRVGGTAPRTSCIPGSWPRPCCPCSSSSPARRLRLRLVQWQLQFAKSRSSGRGVNGSGNRNSNSISVGSNNRIVGVHKAPHGNAASLSRQSLLMRMPATRNARRKAARHVSPMAPWAACRSCEPCSIRTLRTVPSWSWGRMRRDCPPLLARASCSEHASAKCTLQQRQAASRAAKCSAL